MTLIWMGGWRDEYRSDHPLPDELVDAGWDLRERELCRIYLEAGSPAAVQLGWEECLICGADINGDLLTDGTFVWSGELPHHVSEHSVRMPRQFVDHAVTHEIAPLSHDDLVKIEEIILSGGVDDRLWRSMPSADDGPVSD